MNTLVRRRRPSRKYPGHRQGGVVVHNALGHPAQERKGEDALDKAFRAGVQYCFTWNVRQFVLFDSHIQGVPFAQRHIEGPTNVVEASVSDDVRPDGAQDAIKGFWERFLEQFAELISGRRAFEPSHLDQRFIGWLEGALEDPIAHTEDALASLSRTDSAGPDDVVRAVGHLRLLFHPRRPLGQAGPRLRHQASAG